MQVSILAAFVAGLISFLSPCRLPPVPGYVSMLSGIGVEQFRGGDKCRGGLLASSFAFVMGFSVVFVAFGASASAVGQFLLQNKNLLAPFAGAIIVLFGLHLIGLLGNTKIADKFGCILGMPTSMLHSRDGKKVKAIVGLIDHDDLSKAFEGQL